MLVVLAMSLSGCGFLWGYSDYSHHEVPRPDQAKTPMGVEGDDPSSIFNPDSPLPPIIKEKALDYNDCLDIALQRSPYLVSSSLDIDIHQILEDQKWYKMFPSVDLRLTSTYYLTKRNKGTKYDVNGYGSPSWKLSLVVGRYNPWVGYYGAQAQKIFTDIAIERHLSVLENGATQLANAFIDLEALETSMSYAIEALNLAQQGVEFASSLANQGAAASIETTIAEQQVDVAKLQILQMEEERKQLYAGIKRMLGIPQNVNLRLDVHNAAKQVMGSFDISRSSFTDYISNDHDIRMAKMSHDLQDYNIKLAWAAYIPNLSLNVRTPDPVSKSTEDEAKKDDYFLQIGFTTPLFDWGERSRDIDIANIKKFRSRAFLLEKRLKMEELWQKNYSNIKIAKASLKIAIADKVLEDLTKRRTDILYESGKLDFSELLNARRKVIQKQLQILRRRVAYQKGVLSIYNQVGGFADRFQITESQDPPAETDQATPTVDRQVKISEMKSEVQ